MYFCGELVLVTVYYTECWIICYILFLTQTLSITSILTCPEFNLQFIHVRCFSILDWSFWYTRKRAKRYIDWKSLLYRGKNIFVWSSWNCLINIVSQTDWNGMRVSQQPSIRAWKTTSWCHIVTWIQNRTEPRRETINELSLLSVQKESVKALQEEFKNLCLAQIWFFLCLFESLLTEITQVEHFFNREDNKWQKQKTWFVWAKRVGPSCSSTPFYHINSAYASSYGYQRS